MFDVVTLSGSVGRRGACLPEDVLPLKLALYRLGHYRPDPVAGWHPRFDGALAAAIEAFQRAEGVGCDGTVAPDDAFLARLNQRLGDGRRSAGRGRPAVVPQPGRQAAVESPDPAALPFTLPGASPVPAPPAVPPSPAARHLGTDRHVSRGPARRPAGAPGPQARAA